MKTWKNNQLELFDLEMDVGEENALSLKFPERVKEMDQQLVSFLAEVGAETRRTKD